MNAVTSERFCLHCRTAFEPTAHRSDFCCAGCQFIHRLLHERGLEEFYHYGDTITPAHPDVFKDEDFSWLRELQAGAETDGGDSCELTLEVQGISCAGCVWLMERLFCERPGALHCQANSINGTLHLRWLAEQVNLADYAAEIRRFGYFLGPLSAGHRQRGNRPLLLRLGICGALAMNAMLFSLPHYLGMDPAGEFAGLFGGMALGLATLSMAVGGTYFFRRSLGILRSGILSIDLPISLGLIFAYAGSVAAWWLGHPSFVYFDFIAIFTFLMLTGRWLQERAVESNRSRLLQLRVDPGTFRVKTAEGESRLPAALLGRGTIFEVAREQLVPVRSRLLAGEALIGLSWITGEPHPKQVLGGDLLPSGATNFSPAPLLVEALESWSESQLARLLQVEASHQWRNEFLQRVMRTYLVLVLVVAGLGFAVWAAASGDWVRAAQVLISVLVVSCPCSIGIALPLLDDFSAAALQHEGIYVKEGTLWARLQKVRHILFDKTGTITLENLALDRPGVLSALPAHEKSILLGLVRESLHPVAACLRETLLAEGVVPITAPGAPVEKIGFGLEWCVGGEVWRLGRKSWAVEREPAAGDGGTVFTKTGTPLAWLGFREQIRPHAIRQVRRMQERGLAVHLLSGDQPERVAAMAASLGLPEENAHGALTPEEKAALIRARWSDDALMIGDGANDSLAFDAALCRGTPAVTTGLLEQKADFYILGQSLAGIEALFETAGKHRTITRRVFAFAITYNALAMICSLAGLMNPLIAAIIMPLSSIVSLLIVLHGFRTATTHPLPTAQPDYAHA